MRRLFAARWVMSTAACSTSLSSHSGLLHQWLCGPTTCFAFSWRGPLQECWSGGDSSQLAVTTRAHSHVHIALVANHCQAASNPVRARCFAPARRGAPLPSDFHACGTTLRQSGTALGLTMECVPHSLRHRGPAKDFLYRQRDIAALAQRGRWGFITNVQRHGRSGRLVRCGGMSPCAIERDGLWMRRGTGASPLAALRLCPASYRGQ